MQAKKIATQVAQIAKTSDNKRCFDCEQLGTTYYVPQFSVFVCTPCSGVHMQFGHRVKSITLADYTAHEAEQMQEGGNQVAAYRWLARYTPGKDLGKPTDRNPQKIRGWIQTVFVDKRFFSADAPIPRRSTDSATAAGVGASTGGGSGSGPPSLSGSSSLSSSFRRSSSAREGSGVLASSASHTSPVGLVSSPSASRQQQHHMHAGSSPPVHDVREILGDKAPALHVVTKGPSEGAAPAAAPAAAAAAAAQAAPAVAPQAPAVFDPFAAPTQPVSTPAMQPVPAAPVAAAAAAAVRPASTGGFDPFQQQQQQQVPQQHPAAPVASAAMTNAAAAGTARGWASFDDAQAFPTAPQPASSDSVAAPAPAALHAGAPATAAVSASMSNGGWSDFGGDAFPAAARGTSGGGAPAAAAPAPTPAGVAAPAAPAAATPAAGGTGTPKGGKPPAKELAPDLFTDLGFGPPAGATGMVLPQHAAAMQQYQQQAAMAAAMGAGMRPPLGAMQQPLGGLGAAAPGQQQPQVPAHLAWQMQQQAALQWQYQQQVQQQQQQQQQQVPGFGMASPRSAAAWGVQPGFGAAGGFGMQGQLANGVAGGYGMQQQVPPSGPTSTGPTSGGGSQWMVASATAGVTEQNAFADLVDLKSALPPASSSAAGMPAASMPQQMQQMPYGQMGGMPGMPAGYGAPGMMQPQYGAAAGTPAYGQGPQVGMMPQQPGVQPVQQHYAAGGAAGFYGQQQQPAWGMPPAAAPAAMPGMGGAQPSEEGNPFA